MKTIKLELTFTGEIFYEGGYVTELKEKEFERIIELLKDKIKSDPKGVVEPKYENSNIQL